MPPPVPALMDDAVEDILLRLPPDDPGCLFRAAVVCKRWRGLLTGRAFAARYRQFHRAPPLLGFFENHYLGCWLTAPSSPASPVPPIHPGHRRPDALDARHGRVLLDLKDPRSVPLDCLAVWDPLRRRQWDLPYPDLPGPVGFRGHSDSAAVLCGAVGCDHLDCRGGPFRVACLSGDQEGIFYASLYSSEARAWEHPAAANLNAKPKILVGNAVYFTCHCEPTVTIVRYDVASRELSVIDGPAAASQDNCNHYVLLETGDGVLGFANVQGFRLCLWSIADADGGASVTWGQQRVVELQKLLPPLALSSEIDVVAFSAGVGVILLTNAGTFMIEPKSGRVKHIPARFLHAFPYRSFYTPADQAEGIMPMASLENSQVLLQEEGGWREDDDDEDEESGEELEEDLKQAHEMFDMWSKSIASEDFASAMLFSVGSLELRFACHGKLSPKCAYTYYIYGCTALYKPRSDGELSQESDLDFNLAWKMLHIARTILDKCPGTGSGMERVKILCALADVKILSAAGRGSMRRDET